MDNKFIKYFYLCIMYVFRDVTIECNDVIFARFLLTFYYILEH